MSSAADSSAGQPKLQPYEQLRLLREQTQLLIRLQLKWLIGVLLIAFGLLYPSRKLPSALEYSGARDLSQDGYKLYLLNKYRIEKKCGA